MGGNRYIATDEIKKAIGYEEETDMCKNCAHSYRDVMGYNTCGLNPTFPWIPKETGICENYKNGREEDAK